MQCLPSDLALGLQVDGLHNEKLQTVFLDDMPISQASFACNGDKVGSPLCLWSSSWACLRHTPAGSLHASLSCWLVTLVGHTCPSLQPEAQVFPTHGAPCSVMLKKTSLALHRLHLPRLQCLCSRVWRPMHADAIACVQAAPLHLPQAGTSA